MTGVRIVPLAEMKTEAQIRASYDELLSSQHAAYKNTGRGPYLSDRVPFVLTCRKWINQSSPRYIALWVNPSEASWSMPMRSTETKVRGGTIFNWWKDRRRKTFFDEPDVTFTFQSGSILPVKARAKVGVPLREVAEEGTRATMGLEERRSTRRPRWTGGLEKIDERTAQEGRLIQRRRQTGVLSPHLSEYYDDNIMPIGLGNYYDFMDLLDVGKITPKRTPNFVYITYHSLVYPDMLLLGFFRPDGISPSDTAEDHGTVTWSAQFHVVKTIPSFHSARELKEAWERVFPPIR